MGFKKRTATLATWNALSPAQQRVALVVMGGQHNRAEMGELFECDEKTVDSHRGAALTHLGLANSTQLSHFGLRHGLIQIELPNTPTKLLRARDKAEALVGKLQTQLAVERAENKDRLRQMRLGFRQMQEALARMDGATVLATPEAPKQRKQAFKVDNAEDGQAALNVAREIASYNDLTKQQTAVLLLFVRNLSREQVAEALEISSDTLKSHARAIIRKTEDHRLAHLLRRIRREAAKQP